MRNFEKLITPEEIKEIVSRMGKEITDAYNNKELVVVCIMNGAFVFAADLIREIEHDFEVYFLRASSYGEKTVSSGDVKVNFEAGSFLENKDVLVIEDIVDSGNTVVKVNKVINEYKPKSINWASFLSKPSRREVEVDVAFVGKEIEDKFVIGYGLDLGERYRNLPYVGIYQD